MHTFAMVEKETARWTVDTHSVKLISLYVEQPETITPKFSTQKNTTNNNDNNSRQQERAWTAHTSDAMKMR